MKITTKLVASFSVIILLSGIMGFVALRGLIIVSRDLHEVGAVREPSVESLFTIQQAFNGVRASNAAMMIEAFPAAARPAQKALRDQYLQDIRRGWEKYALLPQIPEETTIWEDFVPKFKVWEQAVREFIEVEDAWERSVRDGRPPEAVAAAYAAALDRFINVGTFYQQAKVGLDNLVQLNTKLAHESTVSGEKNASSAKTMIVASMALMVLITGALATLICLDVSRSFKKFVSRITEIRESNDMTRRVDANSKDEIGTLGKAFNEMIQTLHDIIAEVKAGTYQIDAGGSQIASASQSMAQGASEQASSLQQISASIEQMAGQIQQSAENARQANTLAEESKKAADRGQQEMSQMSKAVNEIKQSSAEISKIIKVIDEIAFQTNLLALNAAVEAARAGEAGKGFAVVAEEVRNLAQRSAEAAKNTSAMIEESVKRSENGVQIASRVGQVLEEITGSANKVNTLLAEIASAAGEQATGITQVNQGVSQLDQVTQQNAGNSEEMASSAEELSSQVAALNELVAQFKVANQGNAFARHAQPSKPHTQTPQRPMAKAGASKAGAAKSSPKTPGHKPAGSPNPEQVIPMNNNEVLASF